MSAELGGSNAIRKVVSTSDRAMIDERSKEDTKGFIPLIRPSVGWEELREIEEVLESGWLTQGPKVREFERLVAKYVGAKHAVATSSCTTALSLALESLALPSQSEVIIPDYTFPATANVVARAGMNPVIVDVRRDIFSITPSRIREAMSRKTSAVIPVHAFGHPFEVDEVYEIAHKHSLHVIEDAATAFGSMYKNWRVGHRGEVICFSFHPRKLLTTAEGGCLITDSDEIAEKARSLRNHGQIVKNGKVSFDYNGLNYRMSDVHAAIGLAQLRKIDAVIKSRRRQARVYNELINSSGLKVATPVEKEWAYHTYQSYVILLGSDFVSRDKIIRVMKTRFNIETQLGTYSLNSQSAFRNFQAKGALGVSKTLYARSLTLPLYESLREDDQNYIVDSLSKAARI